MENNRLHLLHLLVILVFFSLVANTQKRILQLTSGTNKRDKCVLAIPFVKVGDNETKRYVFESRRTGKITDGLISRMSNTQHVAANKNNMSRVVVGQITNIYEHNRSGEKWR